MLYGSFRSGIGRAIFGSFDTTSGLTTSMLIGMNLQKRTL
jgi:hypothetical protein